MIDGIVPEPDGGAQNDWDEAARLLKSRSWRRWRTSRGYPATSSCRRRRAKFREMGVFA